MKLLRLLKKSYVIIAGILLVLAVAVALNTTSYLIASSANVAEWCAKVPTVTGEALTGIEWVTVADQTGYKCEVNILTGCIKVTDKATGRELTSNPTYEQVFGNVESQDKQIALDAETGGEDGEETEETAPIETQEFDTSNENANVVLSQLVIQHMNESGTATTLNSYESCAAAGNIRAFKTDIGVRLEYIFGRSQLKRENIPVYFEEAKLDGVLEQVSDDLREAFEAIYKWNFEEEMYVAENRIRDSHLKKVYDHFLTMGYTDESIAAENEKSGIPSQGSNATIRVVMDVSFDNGVLTCNIPMSEMKISSGKGLKLVDIALTGSFGSVLPGTEGYMMIPDGAGAITYFDKNYSQVKQPYAGEVYGSNPNQSDPVDKQKGAAVKMPVFGIKQGNAAFLARIEHGDALATIHADGPRLDNFYKLWPSFRVTKYDLISYGKGASRVFDRNKASEYTYSGDICLTYHFLSGENADYSGMARKYGDLLRAESNRTAERQGGDMTLEFLGAIDKMQPVFGVPSKTLVPLTTTAELDEAAKLLKDEAGPFDVIYNGWFNGGIRHSFSKNISVDGKIGGKSGLRSLVKSLSDYGVGLYPEIGLMTPYYNEGIIFKGANCAKSISGDVFRQYYFEPVAHVVDPTGLSSYLLSPGKIDALADRGSEFAEDMGFSGLTLRDLGNTLYNDESGGGFTREQTKLMVDHAFTNTLSGQQLIVKSPAVYAALAAHTAVDSPLYGNGYAILDRTIPFYQMALHGTVDMTSSPLNLNYSYEEQVLRMAEAGVMPYFILACSNQHELMNSDYTGYYSVGFDVWKDKIVSLYQQYIPIYREIKTSRVKSHTVQPDGLAVTVYDNGGAVLVNYSDKTVEYQGTAVEAGSYAFKKGA